MKYDNSGLDRYRKTITVKKNEKENKTYFGKTLENLAKGNYASRKEIPYVKPTVSKSTATKQITDNTVPKNSQTVSNVSRPSTRYQQNVNTEPKKSTRDTRYDNDFDEFHKYRIGEKIGVMDYDKANDREVEHWRNLKTQIMAKNKWSEKEFNDRWDAYYKERAQKEADAEVKDAISFAKKHPVMGTLLQQVYTPQAMVEGAGSMLSALAPKEYKAQSADDPRFTGTRVKEGIKQAVKDEHIKSGVGKGAYDIGTSLVDMAFSSAIPILGTAALGTQTAGRTNMNALERGVDPTKAAITGAGAGVISGIMNKVGFDKAAGAEAKTALGRVIKGAGVEGAENVAEDSTNLLLDTLLNTDKSQLATLHDYYVSQGMTDDQATKKATLDTLGDLAISGLSGAAFGGAMHGVRNLPELVGDVRALIPELNNKGGVDAPALIDEARKAMKAPAKVEGKKGNKLVFSPVEGEIRERIQAEYDANTQQISANEEQINALKALEKTTKGKNKKQYEKQRTALEKENKVLSDQQPELKNLLDGYESTYKGELSKEDRATIFGERNGGAYNMINLARKFAGETPEAVELSKEAKSLLSKYVESGSKDDYFAYVTKLSELSDLADAKRADYVTKGGNTYKYEDIFNRPVEDYLGRPRQETLYDRVEDGTIPRVVEDIHNRFDNAPVQRSHKALMPENPYFESDSYKTLSDNMKQTETEIDNLKNTKAELTKLLEKEDLGAKAKSRETMTPDEYLDAVAGKNVRNYTPEGKKIKQSIDNIDKRLSELYTRRDEINASQRNLKKEASLSQRDNYSFSEPLAATQKEYQGFDMKKATHNDEVQDAINDGSIFYAEMSPLEYLQRAAYDIFNDSTLENTIRSANGYKDIANYAEAMRNGDKFPIPSLTYGGKYGRGQEGRTRALAAYEAGLDKIPVAIVGKPSPNPYNSVRTEDIEIPKDIPDADIDAAVAESVASSMDPAHQLAERYASAYRDFDTYDDMDNVFDNDSFIESMANDIESGRDLTQYINSLKDMIDDAPDAETEAKMQGLIDELTDLNWDRAYTDGQLTPEEVAVLQDVADGKYDISENGNEVPTAKPTEPTPEITPNNEQPRRSFFDDLPRSDKEGISKVGTNTMVNSKVYTKDQIDNDPVISEINKYAKANNDQTYNAAKENIFKEGAKILDEYTSGKRNITNDLDVDQAMILLTDMAQKIKAGDKGLEAQRNLLFSRLREAGTLYGQTIQAFKKWNNTPEGAIINGEKILKEPVERWKSNNKKKKEFNNKIAKALEQMGVDNSMRNRTKAEKTHEQIKQGVKNVIEREFGSVENLFNDNDIEYLTSLAENKEIPVWVITDEIEHKMNHGEWYTIDESTPVKLETSSKLASILKNMGNDSLKEKNKLPDLGYGESHASIVQKIRNTLAQDPAAVDLDNPADVEVLANFIEEKIPNWQIEDEIHHRLMTGEWYTLDESIEPKKPINQRLKNALDDLVEKGPAPEKEPPTLDEIRNEVRATLDKEMARTGEFTDDDVNYLSALIYNGATKEELAEALNTKMATGKFGISDQTQQDVYDLFAYADRFDPNSKQAYELKSAAYKLLAEETVSENASPLEKFESWRYLAMLGNPKTMMRNFIGNKLFGVVTGVSNNLSAALEAGVDKASRVLGGEGIQRTKTFLNPVDDRALIKASAEDGDLHRYTDLIGSKYEKGTKEAIKEQKSVFNSKLLRLYEAVTDRGVSDYSAVKKKYSTSLAGYMKANGLDESAFDADDRYRNLLDKSRSMLLTDAEKAEMNRLKNTADLLEKARDYAVKQAEYATFHEPNVVASFLTRGSQALRNGKIKINGKEYSSNVAKGLGYVMEGLVPFKKTPANILRSGFEYSPFGAIKSIAETNKLIYENTGSRKGNLEETYTKKSKITGKEKEVRKSLAADVLDSWSKTLTGSGLVVLGYFLKNHGILNSSNDDEKWQDDLEGKQDYSITINGKTYTLDWAAPAVMPLLMGAEISKIKDRNGLLDKKMYENMDELLGTVNAILDPFLETSMMQGVQNIVESAANANKYNNDGGKGSVLASLLFNAGLGYLTQGVPTAAGQIARTVDNTRRATDTVKDPYSFTGSLEKQGRKMMNKLPGLSMLNNPYYDSYGRTQSNSPWNDPIRGLLYQALSPGYLRDINTTAADESARNAYYALGEPNEEGKQLPIMNKDVFASWKSQVKANGERLNPDEMATYRKTSGEAQYAIRDALAKEEWFNNLDASKQTELLKKVNTLVDKIGKDSVDKLDSSSKEFEAYEAGGVPGLINKWKADEGSSRAKEETGLSGSTNAIKEINQAYADGDTKKAEELTEKYKKQNEERLRLNEKYGVNIKMSDFTKREDANPGSNEEWAKEHATTTNTSTTNKVPEVKNTNVDTTGYEKQIERAGKQNKKFTNDLPKLKELNYGKSEMYTYAYAINQDSSLTPQKFDTQFKSMDADKSGSLKQDELINYFNKNNTSQQQAKYLWKTYGENKGSGWKTQPVLKDGTWKKQK